VHSDSSKKRKMTRSDKYFQVTDKTVEGGPSQPPNREISPMEELTPMEISSGKEKSLKGKKLIFSPLLLQKQSNLEDLSPDQQLNNMFLWKMMQQKLQLSKRTKLNLPSSP
jgi:hypothetical protein